MTQLLNFRKLNNVSRLLLPVLFLQLSVSSYGQDTTLSKGKDSTTFDSLQKAGIVTADSLATVADYTGGIDEWVKYIVRNLVLPAVYDGVKVDERIVVVFTVTEKGKLTNIHALAGPVPLQKEAIRLIKESGVWTPAYQHGQPISSECQRRITFKFNF